MLLASTGRPLGSLVIVFAAVAALVGCGSDHHHGDHGQTGTLDATFGAGGSVLIDYGTDRYDYATAVAIQSDGKVVVGATSCDSVFPGCAFALARLHPDGRLDRSFGSEGRVTTRLGPTGGAQAQALALQPDGRIVVAGHTNDDPKFGNPSSFALARYEANGALDVAFGDGGGVVTRPRNTTSDELSAEFASVAVQPDGKIVAAGSIFAPFFPPRARAAVVRYEPDGSLDRTFGTDGLATSLLDRETFGSAAVLQRSGRIVVAGNFGDEPADHWLLLGFTPAGRLDAGFGDEGVVLTDIGATTAIVSLALAADDGLVVASSTQVRRYDARGGLDPRFATFTAPRSLAIRSVAIGADGTVVAAGPAGSPTDAFDGYGVARLRTDGTPDARFGDGGLAITPNGFITDDARVAVTVQPSSDVVVATLQPIEERADADVLLFRLRGR